MSLLTRGALVNLTNPKGLVFLLAVLPQFVVPIRAATPAVPDHRRHDGGRRPGGDGRLRRAGRPVLRLALRRRANRPAVNRVFSGLFATAAVVLSLVRRGATA